MNAGLGTQGTEVRSRTDRAAHVAGSALTEPHWMLSACYGSSCSSCPSSAPIAVPRAEACTHIKLKMSKFTEVNGGAAD